MSASTSGTEANWFFVDGDEWLAAGTLDVTVEVDRDGWLVLKPRNAVAALVLHQLVHGKLGARWKYRGTNVDKDAPFGTLKNVSIRGEVGALLTTAGDPYFTGVSLSDEEQKACRSLLDTMREKKRGSTKKPTPRKRHA